MLAGSSEEWLSASLGLGLERFGLLGASLSAGIGAGVLAGGPLVDRAPRRPLFLGAALLCAVALAGVEERMSLARALAHVFAAGLGGGLLETLLNAATVERHGRLATRPLLVLHAAATLGAVLAPPLLGLLGQWSGGFAAGFRAAGAVFAALALAGLAVRFPPPARDRGAGPRRPAMAPGRGAPVLAALGVVGFAYVGLETGITLFAVPWTRDALDLGADRGRTAISSFWLGLLAARLFLALARRPLREGTLASMGLAGAVLLAGSLAAGTAPELWLAAAGLGLGGVFPIMVARAGHHVPGAPGVATGVVAGAGAMGGFALPWLAGAVGARAGVAISFASFAAAAALLAAAALAARRLGRPA